MKKILLKFFLLLWFIFLPFPAQDVFACSCDGLPTPYKAYKDSTAVFVGKVVGVKDALGKEIIEDKSSSKEGQRSREFSTRYYRFKTQEWFKGTKAKQVTVSVGIYMCESGLNKGSTYLVYAYGKEGSEDNLSTYLFCSRTDLLTATEDDVHFLRALLKNKLEPRIYGSVHRLDTYRYTYLKGIKIVAKSGIRRFETVTDKNGLYRFDHLPNGKYEVYPELPKKYIVVWEPNPVEINLKGEDEIYLDSETFSAPNVYSEFQVGWNNQVRKTGK